MWGNFIFLPNIWCTLRRTLPVALRWFAGPCISDSKKLFNHVDNAVRQGSFSVGEASGLSGEVERKTVVRLDHAYERGARIGAVRCLYNTIGQRDLQICTICEGSKHSVWNNLLQDRSRLDMDRTQISDDQALSHYQGCVVEGGPRLQGTWESV